MIRKMNTFARSRTGSIVLISVSALVVVSGVALMAWT